MVTIGTNESTEFVFIDNTLIVEANNPDNTGTLKNMTTTVVFFDDADEIQGGYAERKGSTYYSVESDLPSYLGNTYYHQPHAGKSIALGGIPDAKLRLSLNLERKATISFWYANKDYSTFTDGATFSIDGIPKETWEGDYNWSYLEYNLEAGSHEIVWTKHGYYYRDNFYHYSYLSLDNIHVLYNEWVPSTAKAITGFRFTSPEVTGIIDESAKTINVLVPYGTSLVNLTPRITLSPGATVNPGLGQAQDFTNPVTYTVTAQDGSTVPYMVSVTRSPPNTAKAITGFRFTSPEAEGSINEGAKSINVPVPYGTNPMNLTPMITVSDDATVSPGSGQAQDFTNPVTYTVTAQDGSTVTYTVRVTPGPNTAKAITGFGFISPDAAGTINEDNKTVNVMVPYGTSLTNLTPMITVSDDATVSPGSGQAQDFTLSVTYTVTAQDGSTEQYTVKVTIESQGEVTLIFPDKAAEALDDTPITISRISTGGNPVEHTLVVNGTYTAYQWWIDGVLQGTGSSFTLSASAYTLGVHRVTLEVTTGNLVYSKQLTFRVEK
jgi:hypothetical protein